MPSFYYRARDASGRPHEGIEVAQSEEDVLRTLAGLKLTPISIEMRASVNGAGRMAAPGLGGLANDVTNAVRFFGRGVQPGSDGAQLPARSRRCPWGSCPWARA